LRLLAGTCVRLKTLELLDAGVGVVTLSRDAEDERSGLLWEYLPELDVLLKGVSVS
jgi:hypothetical protein